MSDLEMLEVAARYVIANHGKLTASQVSMYLDDLIGKDFRDVTDEWIAGTLNIFRSYIKALRHEVSRRKALSEARTVVVTPAVEQAEVPAPRTVYNCVNTCCMVTSETEWVTCSDGRGPYYLHLRTGEITRDNPFEPVGTPSDDEMPSLIPFDSEPVRYSASASDNEMPPLVPFDSEPVPVARAQPVIGYNNPEWPSPRAKWCVTKYLGVTKEEVAAVLDLPPIRSLTHELSVQYLAKRYRITVDELLKTPITELHRRERSHCGCYYCSRMRYYRVY